VLDLPWKGQSRHGGNPELARSRTQAQAAGVHCKPWNRATSPIASIVTATHVKERLKGSR
jgi:hypothetical protein